MRFCDKLKECRKQKKLSQQALADILNVSQSTVGNWESGSREPDFNTLKVIAEFFGVTIDYLLCREVVEGAYSYEGWQAMRSAITAPFHPDQMTPIPVIGKVAAGYTCLAEQYIEGYALADPDSLTDGYDYFWLRVTGDSMEPDIREGDLVLVRVQETVESGECAVVLVDEEDGLIKDIEIGKDHVTLCSKNPNYPPRVFVREEANRVRIVGKVVELKRMM